MKAKVIAALALGLIMVLGTLAPAFADYSSYADIEAEAQRQYEQYIMPESQLEYQRMINDLESGYSVEDAAERSIDRITAWSESYMCMVYGIGCDLSGHPVYSHSTSEPEPRVYVQSPVRVQAGEPYDICQDPAWENFPRCR